MSSTTGTTTWIDLGSKGLDETKRFYSGLFGWTFESQGEEFGGYSIIRNGDDLVGGAMDITGMTCPQGGEIPARWDVYLAVDDLDARLASAQQHGATLPMEPQQIGDAGRMGMLIDPTGAPINVWEPNELPGYDFTGKPGSPVWFELMTHQYDRAVEFYTAVFDAQMVPISEQMDDDSFRYSTNGTQDVATWGLGDATGVMPEEAAGWRIYLAVESCDAAAQKVVDLGGQLLDGPVDSPFGRIATVADPHGATFQISAMSEAVPEG